MGEKYFQKFSPEIQKIDFLPKTDQKSNKFRKMFFDRNQFEMVQNVF